MVIIDKVIAHFLVFITDAAYFLDGQSFSGQFDFTLIQLLIVFKINGQIYNRENVRILNQEARSFIRQTPKKYNLIELAIATAVMLFGLSSGAALATVVGVLI